MNLKVCVVLSLLVGLGLQVGCKSQSENLPAETPQSFPVPGLSFYSESIYSEQVDDSYYFGNRMAVLYYIGSAGITGRNPVQECVDIANDRGRMRPVGYSMIGGYKQGWQSAGRQRYGRVKFSEGQTVGNITSWKNSQGQPITVIQGGAHLVCVMDKKNRSREQAMGFFFEANGQMNNMLNVNMRFSDYRYQFSEVYYGAGFRGRGQQHGPGSRDIPAGRANPGNRASLR